MVNQVDSTATLSLMIFIAITLVYFMIKYFNSQSSSMPIWSILYYLGVIVLQYFINLNVITKRCGTTNWYLAFTVTLIPWIIIFGLLNIMLLQFPGWKAPFSNTFGYLVANLAGAKNLLIDHILKSEVVSELSDTKKGGGIKKKQKGGALDEKQVRLANEAIQHIYSNPSLLINEVTPETYNIFWDRMQPLFKKDANSYKEDLYKLIELKDIVSEAIWFILTGSLVSSMSFNYIASTDCGLNAQEMKKRHDQYESDMKDSSANKPKPRVYTTTQ